jgi:hypothetical protein
MTDENSDILHGTLNLIVLTTLNFRAPLSGYGFTRCIDLLSHRG